MYLLRTAFRTVTNGIHKVDTTKLRFVLSPTVWIEHWWKLFESLSKCKYTYQIDAKFGAQVCLWSALYRDWRSLKNTREIAAEKNDRVDLFCFFAARYKNEFRGSRRLVSPVAKPQIFGEHCNTVCTKFFCCFHTSKKCSLRIWMMPLCHPWATPQNAN